MTAVLAAPLATSAVAPLPLVCPLTLSPLHEATDASGRRSFQSTTGGHHYHCEGPLPALLPPPGVAPLRPWRKSA